MAAQFRHSGSAQILALTLCMGFAMGSCAPETERMTSQNILDQAENEVQVKKLAELNQRLAEYKADPSKRKELKVMAKCMAEHNPDVIPFRTSVCFDTEIEKLENPWSVSQDTSLMEDTTDVYLRSESSTYQNKYGQSVSTTLMIRCRENTTSVIFLFDEYLGLDSTKVQYRIDKEPAVTKAMSISTNNKSAGLWNGNSAIPFAKSLFGKYQLAVRVTPYGENPREMTFTIAELDRQIQPLREACGW